MDNALSPNGDVEPGEKDEAEIVASCIIHIHFLDFLKQLTTFRVEGPNPTAEAREFTAFVKCFLGALWDVYWRNTSLKNGVQI